MMNDEPYNPDDPAFLLSRSLDERLSDDEQRRLDEALASSPSLRRDAEELRALDRLVRRWRREQVALDWDNHARLVAGEASLEPDAAALQKVDAWIQRWGADVVPFNEERFTASVMKKVAREPGRKRRGLIFRLGAPLAAAAAVGFALTIGLWRPVPAEPVSVVRIGTRLAMAGARAGAAGTPKAVVSFGRAPADGGSSQAAPPMMALGAVGPAAPMPTTGESPPL
jgi:hypothetical protein